MKRKSRGERKQSWEMSNTSWSEKAKALLEAAYLRSYREGQRREGVWAFLAM